MTVHLAGSLPKSDLNGLASIEKKLVAERQAGRSYLALVHIETTGAKETAPSWRPEPVMSVSHVEVIPDDDLDEESVRAMFVRLYQERTGRVHLDLPDEREAPAESAAPAPEPLQLETADDLPSFLVETIPGGLSVSLVAASGALMNTVRAKLRDHKGVEFGTFRLWELVESLRPVAQKLIDAYDKNEPVSDAVVDAEVVDDDTPPPSDEDAPADPSEDPEGQE